MAGVHDLVPRHRLGLVSVWLGVIGFAVVVVAAIGMTQTIAPANGIGFFGNLMYFGSLTVVHITGIVLGLMAIFRQNDRRVLGLLGILLNAGFLLLGIFLAIPP
jgi:hypothetical protein